MASVWSRYVNKTNMQINRTLWNRTRIGDDGAEVRATEAAAAIFMSKAHVKSKKLDFFKVKDLIICASPKYIYDAIAYSLFL